MGFFDDLQARVAQEAEELQSDVNSYLNSTLSSVVKIGPQPTSNLTAAQVEAGQTGGPKPIKSDGTTEEYFSQGMDIAKYALPLAIVAAVAFFFYKKRRG